MSPSAVSHQKQILRFLVYLAGMLFLALGITLNTKAGLGASAIVSVPYTISQGTGLDFANLTLVTYCILVAAQFVIKGEKRTLTDLLQIVVSVVFTRFLALFQVGIPYRSGQFLSDLLVLLLGILFTGIGAAMTVDMRLVPNPGDGIVSSIADRFHLELGLAKNCFDAGCVILSLLIGLSFHHLLLGVGIGTILSMLGVGRVIAVFNRLAKKKLSGLL